MRTTKKEKFSKITLALALVTAVTVVASLVWAGDLEPSAAPGPTFKTLDEIQPTWSRALPADDGDPATGCNSSRFDCVMESATFQGPLAVLDKTTGLVWERYPLSPPVLDWEKNWETAKAYCLRKAVSTPIGSNYGWRLPSVNELATLLDNAGGDDDPQLPSGHPFVGVQWSAYWSATESTNSAFAWNVGIGTRVVTFSAKSNSLGVWCVRGPANAARY